MINIYTQEITIHFQPPRQNIRTEQYRKLLLLESLQPIRSLPWIKPRLFHAYTWNLRIALEALLQRIAPRISDRLSPQVRNYQSLLASRIIDLILIVFQELPVDWIVGFYRIHVVSLRLIYLDNSSHLLCCYSEKVRNDVGFRARLQLCCFDPPRRWYCHHCIISMDS